MTVSIFRPWMALVLAACIAIPAAAMTLDLRFYFIQTLAYETRAVHVEWGGQKDGLLRAVVNGEAGAMIIGPDDRVGDRHYVSDDPSRGQVCLDVTNGGAFDRYVRLTTCGNYSGQQWTVKSLPNNNFTLWNSFNGAAMCLDRVVGGRDDGYLIMTACDPSSESQAWNSGQP